jgi:hypothetical protein
MANCVDNPPCGFASPVEELANDPKMSPRDAARAWMNANASRSDALLGLHGCNRNGLVFDLLALISTATPAVAARRPKAAGPEHRDPP